MSGLLNFINFIERINISADILERSLEEDTTKDKPCETEFVSDLDKVVITNEHVDNNLCCAICQDTFKIGDTCIKLPCSDQHFFHCEADPEICQGILPWLKNNNTCPVCRMEFPEEIPENPDEQGRQQEEEAVEGTNENYEQEIMNAFTNPLNYEWGPPPRRRPYLTLPSYPINIVYIPLTPLQAANLDNVEDTVDDNNDDDNNIYNYDTDLQEAIRRSLED